MAFDPDAYLAKQDKKKGFDPDAYLAKTQPETALQTFGRSTASMADSALNAITGTLDYGAYALARAAGRTPEQAQAETTSPKDVVGRAFGVAGTPGYEQAPLRQLGTYAGEVLGENVIQPLAQSTGLPEQDVANMVNTGMIAAGPAVPKVVKPIVSTPVNVAKGALGRATGYIAKPGETPTGYQVPSSRQPLGDTFIPAKEMAELKQGMPISEGAIRPIKELAPGPILALSGGEIPVAGQAARAFGERIGETYSNPYTAAADIGSMFLTGGIPVLTAGRGALGLAQAGADAYLGRKGFTSLTPEQRTSLNQGINPFAATTGAVAPQATPSMAAQTPAAQAAMATTQAKATQAQPQPQAPRRQRAPAQPRPQFTLPDAGTHYAMAEQGSANFADTFNKAVAARTQDLLKDARQTGKKLTPELAAEIAENDIRQWRKTNVEAFKPKQETAQPTVTAQEALSEFNPPKIDPELQMDQNIWARLQEKTKAGTPLVENEQTAVRRITNKYGQDPFQTGNLKGETVMETPKRKNVKQETRVKELEAERTKGMTPEQLAADEQAIMDRLNRMSSPTSKFGKTLKGSSGKGTMGMLTDDASIMSKTDWDQLNLQNTLAEKPTLEPYKDGNKLVTHTLEKVGPFESVIRTEFDIKSGKQLSPGVRITMKKVK